MISPERLFGNLFNDPTITPVRLANFAEDALNKLTAAGNPNFSHIIEQLAAPLAVLQTQLGNVDTSVTQQRGATLTNDQVIADFINTMRTQEGVIANAVGGFKSPRPKGRGNCEGRGNNSKVSKTKRHKKALLESKAA